MTTHAVYLELSLPLGQSLDWHLNARDARAGLLEAARRMRCTIEGTGLSGSLVSRTAGTVVARYEIGVDTD